MLVMLYLHGSMRHTSLKNNIIPGFDDVNNIITLKHISMYISTPLSHIINKILKY